MKLYECRHVPGKGRCLFAAQDIKAGDVIFTEMPLLLYPQIGGEESFCAHCLGDLHQKTNQPIPCPTCTNTFFCTTSCQQQSLIDPGSHNPLVCNLLSHLPLQSSSPLDDEAKAALHFLTRALSLKIAVHNSDDNKDPQAVYKYTKMLEMSSRTNNTQHTDHIATTTLYPLLTHAVTAAAATAASANLSTIPLFSPTEIKELLLRDETNAYGIMASSGPSGERNIRGSGLYATAAQLNHDCMPNVARFDFFDINNNIKDSNVCIQFRALHNLPKGEELTVSYFPLVTSYQERQARCREQYGFECMCPRCKQEATWDEEDEGDGDMEMKQAAQEGEQEQQEGEELLDASAEYVELFVLKYTCPGDSCYGTMAPMTSDRNVYECNMCATKRSEEEFLAMLEEEEEEEEINAICAHVKV